MSAGGATIGEAQRSILFSSFRLDLRGGQLTRAGTPIPLRPKTWAVLVHLAERPGLLVTKEELLDAVWPDVAVTPDTLTKSIGELRLALGDDSTTPRFIATVHRRGFRFIEQTDRGSESGLSAPAWRAGDAAVRPFVGRSAELAQLAEHFARSRAGARQVLFVTGPAGVGKTTVLDAFLDSPVVHGGIPTVWIGRGRCVDQHGPREPYMPVLNALGHLARRPDAQGLVGLLRRTAPTWLAQMPWLLGDDEEALRRSLQAARAERMLREFAALTEALSSDVTLVLALEDLHWSDPATVDLLSLLGQRREPARLLVIGTYRPAEVAVREHPLSRVVHTLHLQRRCVELPVHELSEAEVQHYLEARFPGASLPPILAAGLHAHTDGNPLFVSAVVEHMVVSGQIVETAPGWSFTAAPDAIELGVPDDARRMIATQVESLSPADRGLLGAASVAGLEFAAHTVAAALRSAVDDVEARCETLARPQRFLRFAGSSESPDGSVALRYAFTHALYRQAVYEGIADGTRQRLHQRIGEALEALHGERTAEVAPELAFHFARAGDVSRALRYLVEAAARAKQRFAGREAISYLETALALTGRLPDAAARSHHELELRIALAPLLNDLNGFASEELKENCERADLLCVEVGSPSQRFQILYALCHVYTVRADPVRAPALLRELTDLARRLGSAQYRVLADSALARAAVHAGRFTELCAIAEGPLSSKLHGEFSKRPPAYGADPLIATNCHYAYALWILGFPDRARKRMNVSVGAAARAQVSPFTRAAALALMAILEVLCRNPSEVRHLADQLGALCDEHGFPFWAAIAAALRGWSRVQLGELREGIAELESAHARHAAASARVFSTHMLGFLAEARLRAQEFSAGLAHAEEALRVAETTLDRAYWPELWRLKGELLLAAESAGQRAERRDETESSDGESCLRRALDLARAMEAKSFELRAATSLARAWQARGRAADAAELLDGICGWFGATTNSLDLTEARALRDQLTTAPRQHARPAAHNRGRTRDRA